MRNFVVKYGSIVVNIVALVTFIGIIVSAVAVMMSQGIWAGLLSLWAGITGFIVAFFMIYLVMSINEHLSNICEKLNNRY